MGKAIDWKLGYEVRGRTIDAMEETIEGLLQEIADLKAGRWLPAEDGMVYHHMDNIAAEWNYPAHMESIAFLEVRDSGATIACGSMPKEDEHDAALPPDIRLCRWQKDDTANT